MPRAAKIYWTLVCLLGTVAFWLAERYPLPHRTPQPLELAAFLAVAILVSGRRINLSKQHKGDSVGSMSLGFAVTYAALLRFGPPVASAIGVFTCLLSCLFPKVQRWRQLSFNMSLIAVETLVGGLVFLALNGWAMDGGPGQVVPAVAGSAFVFFLVNTGGVALMISLYRAENFPRVWKDNFSWTAPSYFAGAALGAISIPLMQYPGAVLLVLPIAFFIYHSYRTHITADDDRHAHTEELRKKQEQLTKVYLSTIESMALAIDAKDQYTHSHIVRVQRYAMAIAREVGLSGDDLEAVSTGSLLHDIGKLGVPEYVLLKPGPLTKEEFEKIKSHPEIGAAILDPVEFPWPVIPIVKHHHEKWDGTGYPDGLKGEEIPLTARIMAVADVYDAVTSSRSYRQAWSHERACELIRKEAGTHFDPDVAAAFARVIDGVVADMANEGVGPLIQNNGAPEKTETKAARAAKDIARASTELWALYEVAQSLSSSLGVTEAAQLVARKIVDIFPGTTCVFFIWDAKSDHLKADSAFGTNKDLFDGAHTSGKNSKTRRVLDDLRSYRGEFDPEDLILQHRRSSEFSGFKTQLCVPISSDGRAIGTISLYHSTEAAFSDFDLQLIELIAQRAAAALYNGMLFDRTRGDAITDPLTGVHNLRFLTTRVDELCDPSSPVSQPDGFAVLCLDLDNFKPINDGFGHSKGDLVLKDVARIFTDTVGSEGMVARCGGDEFAIVVTPATRAKAEFLSKRIQEKVEAYDPDLIHPRHGSIRLGVSVGVALYPDDGCDSATLLCAADTAMYAFKTERKLLSLARERSSAAA